MEQVIDEAMIAIFTRGHCLLVGVPGLAKTLLISSLAQTLSLSFKRIQFTPDLMPSDITGTEILQDDPETGHREFKFLPEAQLDRFLFNIRVEYPSWAGEIEIMQRVTGVITAQPEPVLGKEDILRLQDLMLRAPAAGHIFNYAAALVRSARREDDMAPEFVKEWLSYGAGPRASIYLILAGKARAILRGRYHVSVEDVVAVAPPVLRHRIIPNFAAQSEGLTADDPFDDDVAVGTPEHRRHGPPAGHLRAHDPRRRGRQPRKKHHGRDHQRPSHARSVPP